MFAATHACMYESISTAQLPVLCMRSGIRWIGRGALCPTVPYRTEQRKVGGPGRWDGFHVLAHLSQNP